MPYKKVVKVIKNTIRYFYSTIKYHYQLTILVTVYIAIMTGIMAVVYYYLWL